MASDDTCPARDADGELRAARVAVGGRQLSPGQYRWLFPDLTQNLPADARAALDHFAAFGRHEIADGRRALDEARLLELQIQQFSPLAPAAEKSPCFAFHAGERDTLDIYFSYPLPADHFVPPPEHTVSPHTRLYVKETAHRYFQQGIPGVSLSIPETAQWLERVIAWVGPRRVRVIGASAGGYAALVFGHLLAADAVIAVAPEVVLDLPFQRSRTWSQGAGFDPAFQDATPLLRKLAARLALVYPVYDPLDYEMIRRCREQQPARMAYTPTFHPGYPCIDMGQIAHADGDLPITAMVAQEFDFRYDDAAIGQAVRAHEAMMRRDYAASLPMMRELHALDPNNHGFLCHVAFHEALLGDTESALPTMRRALRGMLTTLRNPAIAADTRRISRAQVRNYYDADRRTVGRLERFWDEAAASPA